jgi:sodium-dependent dicarboxylate transporter 2/3/5
LSLYAVPVITMFLLFGLPTDLRNGEFTLDWRKDGIPHGAWEAALITAAAIGMTVALDKFGFTQYLAKLFSELPINRFTLPFVAGYATAIMTEFNSGNASVALMGNIFIPAAKQVGFNPASMAMLMADVAIGKIFPWAGPAAAVCYASGEVSMKDMIKVGLVVTFVVTAAIVLVNMAFSPIF